MSIISSMINSTHTLKFIFNTLVSPRPTPPSVDKSYCSMLSSLPRIRSSISSFSSSKLACKSLAASPVSRSDVIAPLSTTLLSSPHTFYGRNYTHCSDFERSYTQQQRHQQLLSNHTTTSYLGLRQFSGDTKQSNKKKDLRESIDRLKSSIESESSSSSSNGDPNNPSNDNNNNNSSSSSNNPHLETISSIGTSFLRSLAQTWDELIASGQAKDINKKIGSAANREGDGDKPNYSNDDEAADKYENYKGSKDIMVIDPQEHLSAWERMERRLRDAPIIQGEKDRDIYSFYTCHCLDIFCFYP